MGGQPGSTLVGRYGPPAIEVDALARPRLVDRLAEPARVSLVVAPAGYGKTIAVRQWASQDGRPCAWVALDLLDHNPVAFWRDVLGAFRHIRPQVDDLPELILDQFGSDDPSFLAALLAQVGTDGNPAVIVLDGLSRIDQRSELEGLELLVDRLGQQIQFVFIGRSEPRLPSARWRANGWLVGLDEAQLRLTDEEAIAIARSTTSARVSEATAIELCARSEGWPAGFKLALLSIRDAAEPEAAATNVAATGQMMSAYLVTEVLDVLPDSERELVLALSVLDQFDAELCGELFGDASVSVVRSLLRRGLFLERLDDARASMRFHRVFLDVLRQELLWRDPARRIALHRRVAELCQERGDIAEAHRHLMLIGDHAASAALVVKPVLELVDAADRRGLVQLMRSLPSALQIDSAVLAQDLATGWLFAGDLSEAARLCDRADEVSAPEDPAIAARGHTIRAGIALLNVDLESAREHVAAYEQIGRVGGGFDLQAFAAIAAQITLAVHDLDAASIWIETARGIAGPAPWLEVMVPALDAWMAWETGDLHAATEHAERATAGATAMGLRPHFASFETFVIAGWCRLSAGDLAAARALADLAVHDAKVLGCPWTRLRSGLLLAEVRRLTDGPRPALELLANVRRSPGIDGNPSPHIRRHLDFAEASALIQMGALAPASRLAEPHPDSPRKRLLLADIAARYEPATVIEEILGARSGWNFRDILEAELLIGRATSPAGRERLGQVLRAAADTGWVAPFLGHGQAMNEFVLRQQVERVHPRLYTALAARRHPSSARASGLRHDLTPRELTILRLLSTHLSYAEIATQLYLSVNTVKTNLKSLYRKLDVASRSEAVDAASRLDLA